MRLSEPHILFTDGILSIQAIIFAIYFFRAKTTVKLSRVRYLWSAYWISIWFFALNGTIKHFTTSDAVFNVTSKLDVIGGCLGLFWLQIAIPETVIKNIFHNYTGLYIHALSTLGIFAIILVIQDWNFMIFGFYLLFVIFEFIIFRLSIPKIQDLSINKNILNELAIFLAITVFFGLIFLIGRFKWLVYYGNENHYLLNIGNEIFHIGIMYPNYRIFKRVYYIL
jgi:hypothetical protein